MHPAKPSGAARFQVHGMTAEQLSKAFEKLADDDSSLELRFRALDTPGNVRVLSVDARRGTTTRFKLLAEDAAALLELSGWGEPWQRWAMVLPDIVHGFVVSAEHSGEVVARDDSGNGVAVMRGWNIQDAARISAHAVERMWRQKTGDLESAPQEEEPTTRPTGSKKRGRTRVSESEEKKRAELVKKWGEAIGRRSQPDFCEDNDITVKYLKRCIDWSRARICRGDKIKR